MGLGLWLSLWVWPVMAGAELTWSPCWLKGVERAARCGVLSRPLDPAAPQGQQVAVHVAVIPARSRRAAPDPVVFFAGGPGQSAVSLAGSVSGLLSSVLSRREVVLIDQRGTGRSAPLRCEDDEQPPATLAAQLQPLSVMTAQRCLNRLQALPHGDVRQYTTSIAMTDVEAVREAMGVARWNLVGVSYGSRAALEYLRQQPLRVRRMVLDGVVSPTMNVPLTASIEAQRALEGVLARCEGDAVCVRQYPRLRAQWRQVLAGLPREVTVPHPVSGQPERFVLTRDVLAALVHAPLYAPFLAAGLPLAIDAAASGRFTPLVGLAAAMGGGASGGLASGMHLAVVCSEDGPGLLNAPPAQSEGGHDGRWTQGLSEPYRNICRVWPRGVVSEAFRHIAPTSAATLLLSGELDPVTPPQYAEQVRASLGPRAVSWVLSGQGHGQLGTGCVGELVHRFLDAPDDESALAEARAAAPRCTRPRPAPWPMLPLNPQAEVAR